MRKILWAALLLTMLTWGMAKAALIGHYTFDNSSSLGADSSGNGNDATSSNNVTSVSGGVSGGAAYFTQNQQSYLSWDGSANPIAKVLAGDFSFSLWLETTETFGSDLDQGYQDAGIVYGDVPGGPYDSIPMALTGTKLGFDTGYPSDNTLHSVSDINTGSYIFLTVTRTFSTGLESVYVNGILEAQTNHSAGIDLSGRNQLALGGNLTDNRYFYGTIDDFQVYNESLDAGQVAFLYNHPGQPAPVRVQILSPQISGPNFTFSLQTVNGQSYILEDTISLTNPEWTTNRVFSGDGSINQIIVPQTNNIQFFRVEEP